MKKLLLLVTLMLVLGLGACVSKTDTELDTEAFATKDELQLLQDEIIELETRIDNLVMIPGLNGVVDFHENQALVEELNLKLVTLSTVLMQLSDKEDKIDTSKVPEYQIDEFGQYISFDDLGGMIKLKYFDEQRNASDLYDVGDNAYLRFYFPTDMSDEELFVRTVLAIEEIRNYTAYTISYSQLEIHIYKIENDVDVQTHITIPLNIILNDAYTVDCETIYNNWFEIGYDGRTLDLVEAVTLYDQYVADETFAGYVLNYN